MLKAKAYTFYFKITDKSHCEMIYKNRSIAGKHYKFADLYFFLTLLSYLAS